MKRWKKTMLILLCTGAVMSVTACGSDQGADDNVADDHMTTEDRNTEEDRMNDATGDTGNSTDTVDEIGDDIRDGAEDVKDDIRDGADDMTRDNETKDNP